MKKTGSRTDINVNWIENIDVQEKGSMLSWAGHINRMNESWIAKQIYSMKKETKSKWDERKGEIQKALVDEILKKEVW